MGFIAELLVGVNLRSGFGIIKTIGLRMNIENQLREENILGVKIMSIILRAGLGLTNGVDDIQFAQKEPKIGGGNLTGKKCASPIQSQWAEEDMDGALVSPFLKHYYKNLAITAENFAKKWITVYGWTGLITIKVIILIMFCLAAPTATVFAERRLRSTKQNVRQELSIPIDLLGAFVVTSYRSEKNQTDETPFITANGERVCSDGVAVSQDWLKKNGGPLQFGDWVYIENVGLKRVNDTMNIRHKKRFDVWVKEYKDEQQFHAKYKNRKLAVYLVNRKIYAPTNH